MVFDLNEIELIGNVGKDPELVGKNKDVLVFPLATSESWTDKKTGEPVNKVTWHSICIFGKSVDKAHKNIKKGSRLFIKGNLFQSKSEKNGEKKYYTNINCKLWWPISYLLKEPELNTEEESEKKLKQVYDPNSFQDDDIPF